tara:strand:+ start:10084 stop:10254 length:171 start_codon:yes stop_codon:yes gene_type:complete
MRKNRKNFKTIASFEDVTVLKFVDLIQTQDAFFTCFSLLVEFGLREDKGGNNEIIN